MLGCLLPSSDSADASIDRFPSLLIANSRVVLNAKRRVF
jgi:hypothetical protein